MNERRVEINIEDLRMTLEHLKNEGFSYLSFITAVDYLERFELFYLLYDIENRNSILVHTKLDRKNPAVPSVTDLFKGADWHEREVYDLFGIIFEGHPDLRRILLYEGFEGHPLRKDWISDEVEKRPGDFV